ncbi:MAG: hypothetical protein IKH32_10615 [Prevotella sp.]|nr:hypothetical protein [Prevotella sp.]
MTAEDLSTEFLRPFGSKRPEVERRRKGNLRVASPYLRNSVDYIFP